MRKTTGMSLMLLIFLSLCLMTFALLSLSGAKADDNLSQKAADRTTQYYAAVTEANRILSLIDTHLAECLKQAESSSDPESSFSAEAAGISELLPEVNWIFEDMGSGNTGSDTTADTLTLSFSVPVADGQILLAELEINYPESDEDTMYRITAWQTVNTKDWTPDTSQKLYRTTENQ